MEIQVIGNIYIYIYLYNYIYIIILQLILFTSFSANHVFGKEDIYPTYASNVKAWCTKTRRNTECIEVNKHASCR